MTSENGKWTSLSTMGKTWFSLVKPVPWPYLPGIRFLIVLNEKKSSCPESASSSQCFLLISTAEKQDKNEQQQRMSRNLCFQMSQTDILRKISETQSELLQRNRIGAHTKNERGREIITNGSCQELEVRSLENTSPISQKEDM